MDRRDPDGLWAMTRSVRWCPAADRRAMRACLDLLGIRTREQLGWLEGRELDERLPDLDPCMRMCLLGMARDADVSARPALGWLPKRIDQLAGRRLLSGLDVGDVALTPPTTLTTLFGVDYRRALQVPFEAEALLDGHPGMRRPRVHLPVYRQPEPPTPERDLHEPEEAEWAWMDAASTTSEEDEETLSSVGGRCMTHIQRSLWLDMLRARKRLELAKDVRMRWPVD